MEAPKGTDCKTKCKNLLAMLRAMHLLHHTAHLQASGETSYQDHLLFERLYGGLVGEADGLAEKLVSLYGNDAVDAVDQAGRIDTICQRAKQASKDPIKRAYMLEEGLQDVIDAVRTSLKKEDKLSIGMDNFLQGLADTHETACYLLKQRMRKG